MPMTADTHYYASQRSNLLSALFRRLEGASKDLTGPVRGGGFGIHSYSQCGEDIIIDHVFRLRGIPSPSYIDIGANHPYFINNTAMFYERGCRGINIEANPQLLSAFQTY